MTQPRVRAVSAERTESDVICMSRTEGLAKRHAQEHLDPAELGPLLDQCAREASRLAGPFPPQDAIARPHKPRKINFGAGRGLLGSHRPFAWVRRSRVDIVPADTLSYSRYSKLFHIAQR